jgi:hypothetical protein
MPAQARIPILQSLRSRGRIEEEPAAEIRASGGYFDASS